ncbi:hypothetical protein D0907_00540 [Pseudoalteromonas lipolytica]|uniref:Uncharacterized protein n=2 Tax=Pseudoalteromonas lipolytica TaxID=570156 RepID=A0AAD0RX69_9GAMM|nr:hypothetical protein D0907_00540 [Pseudoalteromonas donghaensis]MDX1353167.1 hypothetical protein [Thiomicrorhabdus sp.]|tara:strand:+ start:4681 stop:4926 length:246 start_codon:yes stop_codon:yes gene_type:complete
MRKSYPVDSNFIVLFLFTLPAKYPCFQPNKIWSKVMNPINTLNQNAATHVAVKPTNRKAKMLAKLNRYGKKLALGGAVQYK